MTRLIPKPLPIGLLLAAITACGGGGAPVPDPDPVPGVPSGCDGLAGEYDLSLHPEDTTDPNGEDVEFSLRLIERDGECQAALAAAWYSATVLPVNVDRTQLTLELGSDEWPAPGFDYSASGELVEWPGSVLCTGRGTWELGRMERFWGSFVFGRDAAGSLAAVEAVARTLWLSDAPWSSEGRWVGEVGPDESPPEIRAGVATTKAAPYNDGAMCLSVTGAASHDAVLPWDLIAVEVSEPVPSLVSKLRVKDADGESNVGEWELAGHRESFRSDDSVIFNRFQDWDAVRGTPQTVALTEGSSDYAGNSQSPIATTLQVLDVGVAAESHEFDGTTVLAVFGVAEQPGNVLSAHSPGGIAGRLLTDGKSRVLFEFVGDTRVTIEVAGHAGPIDAQSHWLDWQNDDAELFEVAIDSESEVGFTVFIEHPTMSGAGTVEIKRIWAE